MNALAFGRKAGTTEEYIAMDYIRDSLKEKYIKTELDPFLWVSIWGLYILIFVILILIMLLIIFISFFIIAGRAFGYITLFVSIYFLVYYLLSISIYKEFDLTKPVQRGHISHNVTTKIEANVYRKQKPVIIFCAHYDSVSINYSERIINSMIIFFILYVFIFFPLNLTMEVHFIFKLINIILLFGLLIFFISIRAKNKSVGSVDDASGTAILIELSKLFHINPLNNIDLIFLWTGAEEMGLYGSKAFCYRNFKNLDEEYDLDKSYVINIDMVGSYIGLIDQTGIFKKTKLNISLNNIIEETSREKQIPFRKEIKSISFMGDHTVFQDYAKKSKRNLQVCWFYSSEDSRFIHSPKDTPDKCIPENLNGCIDLCYYTLKKLDTDFV